MSMTHGFTIKAPAQMEPTYFDLTDTYGRIVYTNNNDQQIAFDPCVQSHNRIVLCEISTNSPRQVRHLPQHRSLQKVTSNHRSAIALPLRCITTALTLGLVFCRQCWRQLIRYCHHWDAALRRQSACTPLRLAVFFMMIFCLSLHLLTCFMI